jgi:hypothetical protein
MIMTVRLVEAVSMLVDSNTRIEEEGSERLSGSVQVTQFYTQVIIAAWPVSKKGRQVIETPLNAGLRHWNGDCGHLTALVCNPAVCNSTIRSGLPNS